MTYLAVQISLYLASAALIGICLGWLFWGRSYHRRIAKVHSEMTASLEAERNRSDEATRELKDAEDKLNVTLEAEKAKSAKAVAEIEKLLETERETIRTVRAENEKLRLEMENAVNTEKASASKTIQEAMQHAERLKGTVDEAKTRETQIRAELEELRLMAGAEKLAAQTARAEVEQVRRDMQVSLDDERQTSRATRQALDDIRATLARTFGEGAGIVAALDTQSGTPADETAVISSSMENAAQEADDDDRPGAIEDLDGETKPTEPISVSDSSKPSGIEIEPGTAFNVPGEKLTASHKPEHTVDRIASIDAALDNEDGIDRPTASDDEPAQTPDLDDGANDSVRSHSDLPDPSISVDPLPIVQDGRAKPSSFYEERPHEVDSLQEVDGIDADTEKLLNEHGCYQFRQLAHFSADDIDWLAQALSRIPDLKQRIERDGWIEQARELQIQKYMTTNADRPRWWSRRRLQ